MLRKKNKRQHMQRYCIKQSSQKTNNNKGRRLLAKDRFERLGPGRWVHRQQARSRWQQGARTRQQARSRWQQGRSNRQWAEQPSGRGVVAQ